ncbi:ectin-like [Littorina saxatilis]|uniref:ectin-like n=1 Tax=Littorina saxatilis TaxID=31220 RepID=UPI0038B69192
MSAKFYYYDNDRTSSWGDWLQWGQCSVTCGQGERSRSRTCNPPNVNEAGSCASTCVGDATQFDDFCLATQRCCASKDKVWGSWQPWSSCSAICGEGSKARSRPCVNPDPPYDCTVPCSGLSGSAVRCSVCCGV